MLKRTNITIVLAVASCGFWIGLRAQEAEPPESVDARLEALERQMTDVEKRLAILMQSTLAANTGAAAQSRIDQVESRLSRLESQTTRYRPGAPMTGSLPAVESRLRNLEREVARLRR